MTWNDVLTLLEQFKKVIASHITGISRWSLKKKQTINLWKRRALQDLVISFK